MKKWGILLLAFLLLWTLNASAEGIRGELVIGEGEDAFKADFTLFLESDQLFLTASFFPDWIIRIEGSQIAAGTKALQAEELRESLTQVWDKWTRIAGMKTETGIFSGDLFDTATERKQVRFSWSEMAMALDLIDFEAFTPELDGIKALLLREAREALTATAVSAPDIQFRLDLYEKINTLCFSMIRGNDTIGTLSARNEEDGSIRILIGNAEEGKTYYREVKIALEEGKALTIHASAMADDMGFGYRNLSDDSTVFTEELEIRLSEPETFPFRYTSQGGNGDEALLSVEGTVTAGTDWELQANLGYGAEQNIFGHVLLVSNPDSIPPETENARVVDLMNPEPDQIDAMTGDMYDQAMSWWIPLFRELPPELILMWVK